ncbi:MAG: O-methyltransferase [Elusimicrobiota bacterium]|jgi:predicted O-methyltransferase YrrM|nr:O-methyltransferase [Elusimicrobiota bacterium]
MDYKKVNAYIEGLYTKKKQFQKQYLQDTELEEYGQVIDDDVARMLQVLILSARPQRVLEIGTSVGYSTVMMANAIKQYGGKITTIELDEETARQARINFERQGVDELIEIIVGDARTIVAGMRQKFDFIFQDVGEKSLYVKMIDDYLALLNTGGILAAEDVLFPVFDFNDDDSYLKPMQKSLDMFNKKISECSQFESTLLPIGDGLIVAVKKY